MRSDFVMSCVMGCVMMLVATEVVWIAGPQLILDHRTWSDIK